MLLCRKKMVTFLALHLPFSSVPYVIAVVLTNLVYTGVIHRGFYFTTCVNSGGYISIL